MTTTALVTGASSGIGLELAKLLAADHHNLVLVARNAAALETLAAELKAQYGIQAMALPKDLAKPESVLELAETLNRGGVTIDILINNAGFGTCGYFSKTDLRNELEMIQVNIASLTALTKLFLPAMIARGHGRILNVASTAAFQPGPLMAVYYASKAYVLSFSEALASELRGTGVSVTTLCPGPTMTGFQVRASMQKSRLFRRFGVENVGRVARTGFTGMMRSKPLVIPGLLNRIVAFSTRFAPISVTAAIAKGLNKED